MPNHSTQVIPGGTIKQFRVRIEFPVRTNIHAIEAWMQAENIIQAAEIVMTYFGSLSVAPENVVQLIEVTPGSRDYRA